MEWECAGRLGVGLEILEIHLFLGGLGESIWNEGNINWWCASE